MSGIIKGVRQNSSLHIPPIAFPFKDSRAGVVEQHGTLSSIVQPKQAIFS